MYVDVSYMNLKIVFEINVLNNFPNDVLGLQRFFQTVF